MKCELVFCDWRQLGKPDSVYVTELGVRLSMGDLHSGTTFDADIQFSPEVDAEIRAAMAAHRAYPVFEVILPEKGTPPTNEPVDLAGCYSASTLLAGVRWPSNEMRQQIVPVVEALCDECVRLSDEQDDARREGMKEVVLLLETIESNPRLLDAIRAAAKATP